MPTLYDAIYEKLNATERSDIALAALARGDSDEVKRLYYTCPTKNYRATDHDFTGRMTALQDIALYATVHTQFYYHQLFQCDMRLLAHCLPLLGTFPDLHFLKLPSTTPEGQPLSTQAALLLRMETIQDERVSLIRQLKAIQAAVNQFCAACGIAQQHFNAWLNFSALCPKIEKYKAEDIEADAEETASLLQKFLEVWQHDVGKQQ